MPANRGFDCLDRRYWEDANSEAPFPKIDGELDNRPGKGRFERLTNDDYSYHSVTVSLSNRLPSYVLMCILYPDSDGFTPRLLVFASTKENGKDTLVYSTRLIDSDTGAKADSNPFLLPSRPIAQKTGKGTTYWIPESISVDDKYVALTMNHGEAHRPLYIVDISGADAKMPELVTLPGVTEKTEEISFKSSRFSRDPAQAHVLYLITNAFGDFSSVVAYDTLAGTVIHITTPEPPLDLHPLRAIPWETSGLLVTPVALFFLANVEGWRTMYVVPLSGGAGARARGVLEVHMRDWEGSPVVYAANVLNGRPNELVVHFNSFRMNGFLASIDFSRVFEDGAEPERDERGNLCVSITPRAYRQAAPIPPQFMVHPPKLLKFKSFDGLEVPCMYYHPEDGKTAVPVVISIHGGPTGQSTAETKKSVPCSKLLASSLS